MNYEELDVQQKVSSALEARTAIGLIDMGIVLMRRLDGANDEVHLPLQLLAQGFERLLKLTLVFAVYETTGAVPTPRDVRTHDLENLLARLLTIADSDQAYMAHPFATHDLAFLRSDPLFVLLLKVVSSFAERDRYHDLNVLIGETRPSESPVYSWSEVENALLDRYPEWRARLVAGDPSFDEWWAAMALVTTALVQRFTRALCRMWTLGPAQRLGKPLTGTIDDFLTLRDDELGVPRAS